MARKGRSASSAAGPGDPGLITLKAVQCIREADVIVYDHLVSPEILRHAGEKARLIYAGKQGAGIPSPSGRSMPSWWRRRKRGRSLRGSKVATPSSSAGGAKRRKS